MARKQYFTRTIKTTKVTYSVMTQDETLGMLLGDKQEYSFVGELSKKDVKENLSELIGEDIEFVVLSLEVTEDKYSVELEKFINIAEKLDPKDTPKEEEPVVVAE